MRSLRQLSDELVGIRLNATNISLWQTQAALSEYARISLNDAIMQFPARVEVCYSSGVSNAGVMVLPNRVDEVISVRLAGTSLASAKDVHHYTMRSTPSTVYLEMHDAATVLDGRLNVIYTYHQPSLPADVWLMSDSIHSMVCSGAAPVYTWPSPPGYVELSYTSGGNEHREVARYEALTPTGFTGICRAVEGHYAAPWPSGTKLSLCWLAPDSDLRPVMLMAQAVMYEHFVRHRALYDQYTAIASMQALPLEDLQILIRDFEARARIARRGQRPLPAPSAAKLRKPLPK